MKNIKLQRVLVGYDTKYLYIKPKYLIDFDIIERNTHYGCCDFNCNNINTCRTCAFNYIDTNEIPVNSIQLEEFKGEIYEEGEKVKILDKEDLLFLQKYYDYEITDEMLKHAGQEFKIKYMKPYVYWVDEDMPEYCLEGIDGLTWTHNLLKEI